MKTTAKEFDTVSFFRAEKERIARETWDMNFEELKEYLEVRSAWLEKNKADHTTKPRSKRANSNTSGQ